MTALAATLLLGLQVPEALQDSGERPNRADVEFGAVRTFWWADFRGSLRADGGQMKGTRLQLVDDLHLRDRTLIPIYSGGDISVTVRQTLSEKNRLLFSAEYLTHVWEEDDVLASPEVLENQAIPAGSFVESKFHLTSVTLDAYLVHEEKPFRVGATISMHILSARCRIDNLALSTKTTIRDVGLGGGVFADVRPIPYLFAGISAKGFAGLAHPGDSGGGDFRGYGGVEWGPFRLEGGYRTMSYTQALSDRDLRYVLNGPYAAFSLILRF